MGFWLVVACAAAILSTHDADDEQCLPDEATSFAPCHFDAQSLIESEYLPACEDPATVDYGFVKVKELKASELVSLAQKPAAENVVIDFDASWCEHSRRFTTKLEEVAERLAMRADITVYHVDISLRQDMRQALDIDAYPTILLWKQGTNLFRDSLKFTGKRSRPNILSWISYHAPPSARSVMPPSRGDESPEAQVLFCNAAETVATGLPDRSCTDDGLETSNLLELSRRVVDGSPVGLVPPSDNSLPHRVDRGFTLVEAVTEQNYESFGDGNYVALFFFSTKCVYCACLHQVWGQVNYNLVTMEKEGQLTLGSVNGDDNPRLRKAMNVTKYPTFILTDRQKSRVLGRYDGPRTKRTVFDLSTWIRDVIVADENPLQNHVFGDNGIDFFRGHNTLHAPDHDVVYPYTGPEAYPPPVLTFSSSVTPSIPPTPWPSVSPSPSPACPLDDNVVMTALFGGNCTEEAEFHCVAGNEAMNVVQSVCSQTCHSCNIATHDNNAAFVHVFNQTCTTLNMTECVCQRLLDVQLCDPTETSIDKIMLSRTMYALCPETCDSWAVSYLRQPERSFVFKVPENAAVTPARALARVSAFIHTKLVELELD